MATENRVFVGRELFDRWVTDGRAELDGTTLRLSRSRGTFSVVEAACVVREVTGAVDAHGLVGTARELSELAAIGAEVLDRSLVIGDLAYDVVPGVLARATEPDGSPAPKARTADVLATLYGLSETAAARKSEDK